jgi:ketosteroid isomerase-like protein
MRTGFGRLAIAAMLAFGIGGTMNTSAVAQSGEEAAVNQAVEAHRKAMVDVNRERLAELTADKLSYGHSAGKVESKAEFIDAVASKKTIFKTITLENPSVVVAGNSAIARHIFVSDLETDGKPGSVKIGVLQVWTREGGGWKLLARQAFRL